MKKVLIVTAIAIPEVSTTQKMVEKFVEAYSAVNPNDQIDIFDANSEEIKPLDAEILGKIYNNEDNAAKTTVEKFMEYDKIVFAAPMWNLSIPASLKAYIDYITYAGVTFKYTAQGAVGLVTDKKVLHLSSRGGVYSEGPAAAVEMGDRYLRTICAFLGMTDFTTVALENMGVLVDEQRIDAINKALEEVGKVAKSF